MSAFTVSTAVRQRISLLNIKQRPPGAGGLSKLKGTKGTIWKKSFLDSLLYWLLAGCWWRLRGGGGGGRAVRCLCGRRARVTVA